MYHNCRQQGFHKETKKQNSCVKWQENIPHLWIKIHLRSLKLSQRILQVSWKIIISLLLNDLSCEIYLVWKDHAHRMGYLSVYSYSPLSPLYSSLQASCSFYIFYEVFIVFWCLFMQTTKKRLQWHGLYCGGFYHGDCKRGN